MNKFKPGDKFYEIDYRKWLILEWEVEEVGVDDWSLAFVKIKDCPAEIPRHRHEDSVYETKAAAEVTLKNELARIEASVEMDKLQISKIKNTLSHGA